MSFVYDLTVDPNAENNTHAYALSMIGHNKRVLEVGCATGYFTKALAERGCKVVGMEIDPRAAKEAEAWGDRVVVGNVEDSEIWDLVDDEAFDVVTFGDVLEHLRDPLRTLRMALRKMKPSGFVVASLPNIAHADVRLALLHGQFKYRDLGLLDKTHLHFFTLQSVRELFHEAGMTMIETKRVVMPMFQSELGVERDDFPEAVLEEIREDPEFDTYQFVTKAVLDNGSQAVAELGAHLEELSDEIQALRIRSRLFEERISDYDRIEAERSQLTEQIGTYADHIRDLTRQVNELHEYANAASEHAAGLEELVNTLRSQLAEAEPRIAEAERRYEAIVRSRSFRLTAPLRRLGTALRSSKA